MKTITKTIVAGTILAGASLTGALPTQAAQLQQSGPTTPYPILFVTQPPIAQGFGGLVTTFGNHQATLSNVGRGGTLGFATPTAPSRI